MKRGLGKGLESLLRDVVPSVNNKDYNVDSTDLTNNREYLNNEVNNHDNRYRYANNLYNNDSHKGLQNRILELNINLLQPGKYQPRSFFDEDAMMELSDSIREHGIIQPITVCKIDNDKYEIVAGERRYRAAQRLGISTVPAVLLNPINDEQILELSLIENIQRQDLNPIEEMNGYLRLVEDFSYTQEKIAKMVGKSRSHIANILRLNSLKDDAKSKLGSGELSMGHARALIGQEDSSKILEIILAKNLNVRQTEWLIKNWKKQKRNSLDSKISSESHPLKRNDLAYDNSLRNTEDKTFLTQNSDIIDQDLNTLIDSLSQSCNIKVSIEERVGCKGKLVFHFDSFEQLDVILSKLS